MSPSPLRGCLYWVAIPGEPGAKRRPALVVSVNARNRLANDVLVIPASTTLRLAPTHVRLRKGTGGLRADSVLKCEQVTTLPKALLSESALGVGLPRRRPRAVRSTRPDVSSAASSQAGGTAPPGVSPFEVSPEAPDRLPAGWQQQESTDFFASVQ